MAVDEKHQRKLCVLNEIYKLQYYLYNLSMYVYKCLIISYYSRVPFVRVDKYSNNL